MKISPSILAAPLARVGEAVKKLDAKVVDYLHIDVMDGHFVPVLTFGEQFTASVQDESDIPLDIHLMVSNPQAEVPKYFALKPAIITYHYEATSFPVRLAQTIREQGISSGIALNPSTPTNVIREIFPFFDVILLMTVEPGYYGQSFLPNSYERLEQLDEIRSELTDKYNGHWPSIQIDGGVNDQNAAKLFSLGSDILVAGSFVFKQNDANAQVLKLKGK